MFKRNEQMMICRSRDLSNRLVTDANFAVFVMQVPFPALTNFPRSRCERLQEWLYSLNARLVSFCTLLPATLRFIFFIACTNIMMTDLLKLIQFFVINCIAKKTNREYT